MSAYLTIYLIGLPIMLVVFSAFYHSRFSSGKNTWWANVFGAVFWAAAWPLAGLLAVIGFFIGIGRALAVHAK